MATLKLEIQDSVEGLAELNGLYISKDIARVLKAMLLEALRSGHAARGMPPVADLLEESPN